METRSGRGDSRAPRCELFNLNYCRSQPQRQRRVARKPEALYTPTPKVKSSCKRPLPPALPAKAKFTAALEQYPVKAPGLTFALRVPSQASLALPRKATQKAAAPSGVVNVYPFALKAPPQSLLYCFGRSVTHYSHLRNFLEAAWRLSRTHKNS